MRDPVNDIRTDLVGALGVTQFKVDKPLARGVPWSPHLYDARSGVAWQILVEAPEGRRWAERMSTAAAQVPGLKLGICAPASVLYDDDVLDAADSVNARIATFSDDGKKIEFHDLAADFIYGRRLRLSHEMAKTILDRWLTRCSTATIKKEKGITLEVLTAVMLSQVEGFEVRNRGISNRSQQIDVQVHNRRTHGILANSQLVIAEAKNWSNAVGTTEYYSVYRKVDTTYGRSRLGFFVTTDRFTRGVRLERLKDARHDILIVPLDRDSLPDIWRSGDDITANVESAAIAATSD